MRNVRMLQFLLAGILLITLNSPNAAQPSASQVRQPKSSIGLLGTFGYVVDAVERGGKADLAGLKTGDVVVRVNNRQFDSIERFNERLRSHGNGAVELEVIRRVSVEYTAKLLDLPASVSVEDLGLSGTLGFIVQEALPNTPAQQADFQPGDVIIGFEGRTFSSSLEFRELGQREPGTRVVLKVQRRENDASHKYDLSLALAPMPASLPVR